MYSFGVYQEYNRTAELLERELQKTAPLLNWTVDKIDVGEFHKETERMLLHFCVSATAEINGQCFFGRYLVDIRMANELSTAQQVERIRHHFVPILSQFLLGLSVPESDKVF